MTKKKATTAKSTEVVTTTTTPTTKKTVKPPRKRLSSRNHIIKRGKNTPIVLDSVEKFMVEYLKNGGRVTDAALTVGNFKSRATAGISGSRWLAKAKSRGLIRTMLEKRGYNHGKLIDVALEKMEKSKKPDWWDRIMKMANYEDFVSTQKAGVATNIETMNIFGAHRKLSEEYIEDGDVVSQEEEPQEQEDED